MALLHPFTMPVRVCRIASSIVTLWGYKVGDHPSAHLHPLARNSIAFSPPSLCLKRERKKNKDIYIYIYMNTGENFWGLESIASPSLSNYGSAGWVPSEITQAHLRDLMS
jgi:hypothetical protein